MNNHRRNEETNSLEKERLIAEEAALNELKRKEQDHIWAYEERLEKVKQQEE